MHAATRHHRTQGSALLLAMLVVAMVATLAAAGYWRQWQAWETERAERQRAEASWILTGAVDWARFILRADARASQNDHLGEPWGVPLQEARLSDFLAAERGQTEGMLVEAFLSGEITDQQGRINLRNLIATSSTGNNPQRAQLSAVDVQIVQRLFALLGLPGEELAVLLERLPLAMSTNTNTQAGGTSANANAGAGVLLRPSRLDQLGIYGLSTATLQALAPHATWLPERTTLNLNTASLIALQASLPGLDPAQVQALAAQRQQRPFAALDDPRAVLGGYGNFIVQQRHGLSSRYFTVRGRLRLDDMLFEEQALLERDSRSVSIIWRINAPPDLAGLNLPADVTRSR